MRCIEINEISINLVYWTKINRNMRCIEINAMEGKDSQSYKINRNMRCIEIQTLRNQRLGQCGLIET